MKVYGWFRQATLRWFFITFDLVAAAVLCMKKLLTALLGSSLFAAHAQVPYSVSDSFENNRYEWYTGEADGGTSRVQDGRYRVSFPKDGWVLSINPYVAPRKDFVMEATIRQTGGVSDYGIGLVWGYNKKRAEYNYFQIASTGYYYISPSSSERKASPPAPGIHEWIKTDLVKSIGQDNVLRVEQKGDNTYYYLNGKQVATTHNFGWVGKSVGFVASAASIVEFDNFSFKQEGIFIPLPENLKKGFKKENLGPNINTEADDLIPRISADGKALYFGRENYIGNIGGKDDGEDFYFSSWDGKGWTKAENMGPPVNTTGVDNILSVSTDENTLLFVRDDKFWSMTKRAEGWGAPEEIGISYVNQSKHFEACLSADGKAILFTIENENNVQPDATVDEKDIYFSLQDENGRWSAPQNCGPSLNTGGNEIGPFLAADGRTLYFSTNGRPGYGGNDIFMSKRIGSGWTQWSEPVNLGPEINTPAFDAYYVVPASGDYAYMATDDGGFGLTDIVRIKLAAEIKPEPVVLVRGRTLDAETKKPVQAQVLIDNLATHKEVGEATSDAAGAFTIVLPFGTNYGFRADAPGYLAVNENLELITVTQYTEMEKDLYLVPIRVGEVIRLNNVFFEQGRPLLKPESYVELDRLIAIMKENPNMEVELAGHTDNNGNAIKLTVLSQDRVTTVKNYMVSKGIAARRITGRGYGGSKPLEKNDTEEHRRMNRRVEFKILRN